jgi:hypothetical protein
MKNRPERPLRILDTFASRVYSGREAGGGSREFRTHNTNGGRIV